MAKDIFPLYVGHNTLANIYSVDAGKTHWLLGLGIVYFAL